VKNDEEGKQRGSWFTGIQFRGISEV
jgi:hypothetical protein